MNRLTARIAAHGLRRQVQALGHADALGDAAERLVHAAWLRLLAVIRTATGPHDGPRILDAACTIFAPLGGHLIGLMGQNLEALATQTHATAAEALTDRLPVKMLAAVALRDRPIQEDEAPIFPGLITFMPDAATPFTLPITFEALSAEAQKELFQKLLFPPPPLQQVRRLVYAGDWWQRLETQTKLALPDEIAPILRRSFAAGQSIRDLARDLLPAVDGVRSTARRIARSETMRISHTIQWQADQQVDELIVGHQVFAVDGGHSPSSRPEHKKRHATIYYKQPRAGQKGMDECPHPPYEADGTLAFGCRCWLAAVFMDPDDIAAEPVRPGTVDPELTAEWFDEASERERQTAVGVVRYRAAKRALGRKPRWGDLVGTTGELLEPEEFAEPARV